MADLGTATIQCTLGAGYIDTSEAERLEGEIAGKDAEIAALEAKVAQLEKDVENAAADANAVFISVIDRSVVNLVLPALTIRIGTYAFYTCYNIKTVAFPANLVEIGQNAFQNCSGLKQLTFPAGLKKIGQMAFAYCGMLSEVTFEGTPTQLNPDIFLNCRSLHTINVPWAEGEVYGAPWGATNATINYNYTGGDT